MNAFPRHDLNTENPEAASLLATVQNKYNFIPSLFEYMAEAPAALEAYMNLAGLIAKTSLTGPQAQIIQLALSVENECGFCQTAHTAMSKMNKAAPQTVTAIIAQTEIEDASDRALVDLALKINRKRGWLDDADLQEFFDAGFAHQQVLEVILCVTIKTLSNYTNHLTKPIPNPELVQGAAA